jgi:predicted RNA-binding Zn-ribbon protein involved in translation (DUF1610 family)
MCGGRAVDGASSRTSLVAQTNSMLTKSLVRCHACRLTWFPKAGTGAACPACGGAKIGRKLEPFHLGLALIAAAVALWARPFVLGEGTAAVPAVIESKLTAEVEKGPSQGQAVTLRPGEEVTVLKQEHRRVLVKDRRGNQVYVSSNKVNKVKSNKIKRRKKKAKTRSQHVQR